MGQYEVGAGLWTDRGKRLRLAGDVPPYHKMALNLTRI